MAQKYKELKQSGQDSGDIFINLWDFASGNKTDFNYKAAGYDCLKDFVDSMYCSEKDQLLAMCRFIKSNSKMYNALKNEDWAGFARLYNGSGYAANKYDEKLKKAFDTYKNIQ